MNMWHVIVCIAGSSKALGNPASTGLHLLFFLLVSPVNGPTGICCLTSAHMKMCARAPSADMRRQVWMPHYSESFIFFFKWSFWEKEEIQIYNKWKRKQMKEASIYLTRAAREALRGWPSQSWNYFGNRNIIITGSREPKIQKNPIRPKLYSSFDQCGICIFRCRTRFYPVQLEYISLLDICF